MDDRSLQLLVEELLSRKAKAPSIVIKGLFRQQEEFIKDTSERKAALCARRAGKTYAAIHHLINSSLDNPNSTALYLALTRGVAKSLVWQPLKTVIKNLKIPHKVSEQDLVITLKNGSNIWLSGADKAKEIEKFRGQAYCVAVLDESASYGMYLQELIDDVITPALGDVGGSLALIGTPGKNRYGLFYEATQGEVKEQYSQHNWSRLDNLYFPAWADKQKALELLKDNTSYKKRKEREFLKYRQAYMEELRNKYGLSENNPLWRREYLGEWVVDLSGLVIKLTDKNVQDSIPDSHYKRILGIDLGWNDSTAFIDVCYSMSSNVIYLANEMKQTHMLPDAIAKEVKRRQESCKYSHIIADTGGGGKTTVEDLNDRHGLNIEPAVKKDKLAFIDLFNSELFEGRLHVVGTPKLKAEMLKAGWNKNKTDFADGTEDHLIHAALYGVRACPAWNAKPIVKETSIERHWKKVAKQNRRRNNDYF